MLIGCVGAERVDGAHFGVAQREVADARAILGHARLRGSLRAHGSTFLERPAQQHLRWRRMHAGMRPACIEYSWRLEQVAAEARPLGLAAVLAAKGRVRLQHDALALTVRAQLRLWVQRVHLHLVHSGWPYGRSLLESLEVRNGEVAHGDRPRLARAERLFHRTPRLGAQRDDLSLSMAIHGIVPPPVLSELIVPAVHRAPRGAWPVHHPAVDVVELQSLQAALQAAERGLVAMELPPVLGGDEDLTPRDRAGRKGRGERLPDLRFRLLACIDVGRVDEPVAVAERRSNGLARLRCTEAVGTEADVRHEHTTEQERAVGE